jgi:hypothetical protein
MPPGHQPRGHGNRALSGGVPWESEDGSLLQRWWETVTATNFRNRELFAAVAQGDDAMSAVMFSTMTNLIIALAWMAVWGALMALFFTAFVGFMGSMGGPKAAATMAGTGAAILVLYGLGFVFIMGLAGFIGPWLLGGLHHLVLLMVNGVPDGKGYADTVRVTAYGGSASMLFAPIPIVGSMIALVFNAVNHVSGYDVVHGCGGGKAFLAWVSPLVMSCCCNCLFMTMVGSIG